MAKKMTEKNISLSTCKYITYFSIFIGYSVYFYNRKSYTSLIPTFLETVGLQESEIGAISSSFALSYGLSKFISGVLSDKLQPRGLFIFGLIGTGLCNTLFSTCSKVYLLIIVWFLNGLCQGLSWPPCSKLLKEWFSPAEIGTFWSLLTVGCNLTSSLCPLLSIYLASNYRWQMAMLFPSFIALFIAPMLYMFIYNTPAEASRNQASNKTTIKDTHSDTPKRSTKMPKMLFLMLQSPFLLVLLHGYFLTSLLKSSISDWVQVYLIQTKKQPFSTAGFAMSSFEIGGMVGSILVGVITDSWMKKHDTSKKTCPRMPIFMWLYAIFLVCIHVLRTMVDRSSSMIFIAILLFGCGLALSGSVSIYGLVAMENGPVGYSGTSHAIVALGASVGSMIAGYPFATIGKSYGWEDAFLLLQTLGAINFIVHIFTCNLSSHMADTSKLH